MVAQRAGDEAFDAVFERGGRLGEAAIAYHVAYQRVAKATGCGPWCECDLCTPEDPEPGGEHPAAHADDLLGW